MIFVKTLHLKTGMILGRTLYDPKDSVLLTAYSVLTDKKIQKVKELKISGLFVLEQFENSDEVMKNVFEEIRAMDIKTLDVNTVLEVATKLTHCITESRSINLTMLNLKEFDDYTYYHSVNVAILSCTIAKKLGYHTKQLVAISLAGLLHDFGKLNIDKKILNATRRLTEKEFELIKTHPVCGYNLFKDRKEISNEVKLGILQHHEEEDGSGYPNHLKGNEISEFAKIIHVADVYDALVSKRPYKEPYPVQEAIEFLLGSCDTKFDREIVEAFIQCVPVYPLGTKVLLSNNREATVVDNTNTIRPVIELDSGEKIDLASSDNYNITIITSDIKAYDTVEDFSQNKLIIVSGCLLNTQVLEEFLGIDVLVIRLVLLGELLTKVHNIETVLFYRCDRFNLAQCLIEKINTVIALDSAPINFNGKYNTVSIDCLEELKELLQDNKLNQVVCNNLL